MDNSNLGNTSPQRIRSEHEISDSPERQRTSSERIARIAEQEIHESSNQADVRMNQMQENTRHQISIINSHNPRQNMDAVREPLGECRQPQEESVNQNMNGASNGGQNSDISFESSSQHHPELNERLRKLREKYGHIKQQLRRENTHGERSQTPKNLSQKKEEINRTEGNISHQISAVNDDESRQDPVGVIQPLEVGRQPQAESVNQDINLTSNGRENESISSRIGTEYDGSVALREFRERSRLIDEQFQRNIERRRLANAEIRRTNGSTGQENGDMNQSTENVRQAGLALDTNDHTPRENRVENAQLRDAVRQWLREVPANQDSAQNQISINYDALFRFIFRGTTTNSESTSGVLDRTGNRDFIESLEGLSEEALSRLHEHQIEEGQCLVQTQCSVCLEDFKVSETLTKLDCDHEFHSDCIKQWLRRHSTCCLCRRQLSK